MRRERERDGERMRLIEKGREADSVCVYNIYIYIYLFICIFI